MRVPDRRTVPAGLGGLAGFACLACCAIPALLAAGIIGGAGWIMLGRALPALAVGLVAAAAVTWWWMARRRRRDHIGCAGGDCSCDTPPDRQPERPAVASRP
ncbi:hypothetical protein ACL02O_03420 [Micromonospora sp. MS34]|uniref:hypothetical protein n=1 Tax=Micromonospora sp. MS34 TaxID=3385971 RepID=UPI0039A12B42